MKKKIKVRKRQKLKLSRLKNYIREIKDFTNSTKDYKIPMMTNKTTEEINTTLCNSLNL